LFSLAFECPAYPESCYDYSNIIINIIDDEWSFDWQNPSPQGNILNDLWVDTNNLVIFCWKSWHNYQI
jgi:hypothetical protein